MNNVDENVDVHEAPEKGALQKLADAAKNSSVAKAVRGTVVAIGAAAAVPALAQDVTCGPETRADLTLPEGARLTGLAGELGEPDGEVFRSYDSDGDHRSDTIEQSTDGGETWEDVTEGFAHVGSELYPISLVDGKLGVTAYDGENRYAVVDNPSTTRDVTHEFEGAQSGGTLDFEGDNPVFYGGKEAAGASEYSGHRFDASGHSEVFDHPEMEERNFAYNSERDVAVMTDDNDGSSVHVVNAPFAGPEEEADIVSVEANGALSNVKVTDSGTLEFNVTHPLGEVLHCVEDDSEAPTVDRTEPTGENAEVCESEPQTDVSFTVADNIGAEVVRSQIVDNDGTLIATDVPFTATENADGTLDVTAHVDVTTSPAGVHRAYELEVEDPSGNSTVERVPVEVLPSDSEECAGGLPDGYEVDGDLTVEEGYDGTLDVSGEGTLRTDGEEEAVAFLDAFVTADGGAMDAKVTVLGSIVGRNGHSIAVHRNLCDGENDDPCVAITPLTDEPVHVRGQYELETTIQPGEVVAVSDFVDANVEEVKPGDPGNGGQPSGCSGCDSNSSAGAPAGAAGVLASLAAAAARRRRENDTPSE